MTYQGYGTGHALVNFYFPADGSTNPDVFQPKTFSLPREIVPQNVSSLGFTVSEELGNIQTDTLTDWCFDREIIEIEFKKLCKL